MRCGWLPLVCARVVASQRLRPCRLRRLVRVPHGATRFAVVPSPAPSPRPRPRPPAPPRPSVLMPAYGLTRARERAGLSRYKLAEVAGVCHSALAAWELGEMPLHNGHSAQRLARALGVPVVEILPYWCAVRDGLRPHPLAGVDDAL